MGWSRLLVAGSPPSRTLQTEDPLRSQQRSYTRRVETVMRTAPVASQDLGLVIIALLEHSIAQNDQIIALL